jgi:hypothetical protein
MRCARTWRLARRARRSGSPAVRCHCRYPNLVRAAPPLCPDVIFGNDRRNATYSHHSIPQHVLVLGGKPGKSYYALVCRCDTELALGDHGLFNPAQCLTLASGLAPGPSQRAALLKGQIQHSHGAYRVAFKAQLVEPWFVKLTKPRALSAAELVRARQYKPGDDWLSLVKSLRD